MSEILSFLAAAGIAAFCRKVKKICRRMLADSEFCTAGIQYPLIK